VGPHVTAGKAQSGIYSSCRERLSFVKMSQHYHVVKNQGAIKIQLMMDLTTMLCVLRYSSTCPMADMRKDDTNVTQQGGCCCLDGSHVIQLATYNFSSRAQVEH